MRNILLSFSPRYYEILRNVKRFLNTEKDFAMKK